MSEVIEKITAEAQKIYDNIKKKKRPVLESPIRALSNVKYNVEDGFFELKGSKKSRTLTASSVKTFAQTLKMMALSKEIVEKNDIATKREAYYVSKNWGDARFKEQPESDTVMDDIEAMLSVNREKLGFIPEEKGGDIAGKLIIIDKNPDTGKEIRIDCTKFGSGAYSIPSSVEELKFETEAKFILAIETAGMFQRLVKHNYWKNANCILVSMGGVPTRACRRFIRKLSDEMNIPVLVFTDGDFYGYFNIYRTLKVGSGNAAHINEYFCVPKAKFIGITPQDIIEYKLPTHPMKEVDIKRGKDALKNDPFVHHHKQWQKAIKQQIEMKARAEQQALAKWGLNFVIDNYLPEKMKKRDTWLP
ncbi:MAG: DNA topoisomerase IV subunit A [Nanoarchaeota archaeon]|nr:DNA topoisomerase IV subunit A [Nanoarchaeota archaeon]MBU1269564.1 DNA topoisomerase IV subunit A [Nanoarchaeota archaeon]MBU1604704.1 DNA topoisomerase IV subunit A [Nanoarchaeota archaeon]MBU2443825.1 DNA topoisomerase IV subunit A [Nanoarchaeota archaeon]